MRALAHRLDATAPSDPTVAIVPAHADLSVAGRSQGCRESPRLSREAYLWLLSLSSGSNSYDEPKSNSVVRTSQLGAADAVTPNNGAIA